MYHRSDKKDEQSSVTSNLYQSGNTRDGSCRISTIHRPSTWGDGLTISGHRTPYEPIRLSSVRQ